MQNDEREVLTPAASQEPWAAYFRNHGRNITLVAVVAWVANYLHFMSFGLYEDDWFFVGFPFLVTFRDWMLGSLVDQFKVSHFQGRPLQMAFGYLFTGLGALTNTLAVDYLIAYLLFAGSAVLMYEVLRRRFPPLLSLVASILFVLTPLHTLHQFLNGQLYSFGPAFIFLFIALLFYQQERFALSYFFAVSSLFSYESIFFIFLGAPLLRPGNLIAGRWREWLRHTALFCALVVTYFIGRRLLGESRVTGLPSGSSVLASLVQTTIVDTITSFALYLYGFLRAHEATVEGWFYALLLSAILIKIFYRHERTAERGEPVFHKYMKRPSDGVIVGLVFLMLGYALSYFISMEPTPTFHATDRATRVSGAASFGSSIVVAALFFMLLQKSRTLMTKLGVYGATTVFIIGMFLYSFVLQQDYIQEWEEQRSDVAQLIKLTPDVERDSVLILELHVPGIPFFTSGRRRRAIGLEKTLFEYEFPHIFSAGEAWPRVFVVYSDDWVHNLKLDADGLMSWKKPVFEGRWYAASGDYRYRPGRFIVLEEVEPGWLVRHSEPIVVDGQQVVQQAPLEISRPPLWTSLRQTALSRSFLPDYSWKYLPPAKPAKLTQ
jgi:hypothetical protein